MTPCVPTTTRSCGPSLRAVPGGGSTTQYAARGAGSRAPTPRSTGSTAAGYRTVGEPVTTHRGRGDGEGEGNDPTSDTSRIAGEVFVRRGVAV